MPPVAEALQVTGLPAVAAPHVTVTVTGWPPTAKLVTDFDTLLLFVSVTLTFSVYVPLASYETVKLNPVPVDGVPPAAVHLYV